MGWSNALELLVKRMETHTPARDPQVRYKLNSRGNADRSFEIGPPGGLVPQSSISSDPVTATFFVLVRYRSRTEELELFKDVGDDAEDLFQRIAYYYAGEWAKAAGYDFIVEETRILDEGEGLTLQLEVSAIYNMME